MSTQPEVTVMDVQLKRLELPLPGGRVLHLALVCDDAGAPVDLVLAAGFGGRPFLQELAEGLCVPASTIPGLRDALQRLERPR